MLKAEVKDQIVNGFIATMLVTIFVVQGGVFFQVESLCPDERWFLGLFESYHAQLIERNWMAIPNALGYGQVYWVLGGVINNMYVLRGMAFLLLNSMSIIIWLTWKKWGEGRKMELLLALLVWWCSPLCWFSGKLIGPEIFSMGIGLWGICLLNCGRKFRKHIFSGILLGISIGIKINSAVLLVYPCAFMILSFRYNSKNQNLKNFQSLCILLTCVIIAFVICNPILLYNFSDYKENAISLENWSLKNIENVVWGIDNYTWDGIFSGGILGICLSFFLVPGLLICGYQKKYREIWLSLGVTLIAAIIVCCRDGFLGWYFIPIAIFPSLLFLTTNFSNWRGKILAISVILNCIALAPISINNYYIKMENINATYRRGDFLNNMRMVENLVTDYNDYPVYWFVNTENDGKYRYNFNDYLQSMPDNTEEKIYVIADWLRCVPNFRQIINSIGTDSRYSYLGFVGEKYHVIKADGQ